MNELAKRRAEKSNDSKAWSPEDALEELLERVKAGKVKPVWLAIHYLEEEPDGGRRHHHQCAGLSYADHIALLTVALQRALKDWQK